MTTSSRAGATTLLTGGNQGLAQLRWPTLESGSADTGLANTPLCSAPMTWTWSRFSDSDRQSRPQSGFTSALRMTKGIAAAAVREKIVRTIELARRVDDVDALCAGLDGLAFADFQRGAVTDAMDAAEELRCRSGSRAPRWRASPTA
ncbi:MAG: hypothetical protein HOI95_11395, partial [Chromatiales bacterium]|nr:hypothetical protein [Chromatiales bacterium]